MKFNAVVKKGWKKFSNSSFENQKHRISPVQSVQNDHGTHQRIFWWMRKKSYRKEEKEVWSGKEILEKRWNGGILLPSWEPSRSACLPAGWDHGSSVANDHACDTKHQQYLTTENTRFKIRPNSFYSFAPNFARGWHGKKDRTSRDYTTSSTQSTSVQKYDSIDSIIDFSARRPFGMRQNSFASSLKKWPSVATRDNGRNNPWPLA